MSAPRSCDLLLGHSDALEKFWHACSNAESFTIATKKKRRPVGPYVKAHQRAYAWAHKAVAYRQGANSHRRRRPRRGHGTGCAGRSCSDLGQPMVPSAVDVSPATPARGADRAQMTNHGAQAVEARYWFLAREGRQLQPGLSPSEHACVPTCGCAESRR